MKSRKNTLYAVLIGLFVVGGLAPAVIARCQHSRRPE